MKAQIGWIKCRRAVPAVSLDSENGKIIIICYGLGVNPQVSNDDKFESFGDIQVGEAEFLVALKQAAEKVLADPFTDDCNYEAIEAGRRLVANLPSRSSTR
ncbi:MAG: hypothetical protein UT48_C0024G0010 [Parcubacteria group bacterium GW2011_GWE2_39_37]|uniref:Uncharacterized protein n=1 Tax=Candidatus Falkowbacteria bacterium GW2011_GWF2_39_8 TaxID=1618642 RepID=A0A0G0T3S6_9BACT|nr:MAG: hypothetical protein UT48_C0024G0010 [Parcubacteria group bacterium GW2011_GWE2_39_37]KKR32492.1 MAG: hypothetical protein UT64_C0032G0006 [Candidatus Falkowbacteria bacterium GW2011_GWF2_39_8]